MKDRKDYVTIVTICLLILSSMAGILSMNFHCAYEFMNQYGHKVQMYGYGIYANDTYFQAPISIGTDFTILLILVPLFLFTYLQKRKHPNTINDLKLASVYGVSLYYATSMVAGITYNKLFLVYVALFSCSLFGMFRTILCIKLECKPALSKGLHIFLLLSGVALIVAWLPDIIPTMISGETLALIGVYTTCITYVLDMGIIAPLCMICIAMLRKGNPIGIMIEAIILKACIFVGILMVPQMICQGLSGCDLPLPVLMTKSFSFILLGGFAFYFNHQLYRGLEHETISDL